MPVEHYENFPVASLLLPARLRPAVEAVYAFARAADDIADEGDASPEQRLRELDRYEAALDRIAEGRPDQAAPFGALDAAVRSHALPLQPLRDLLSAFRQDVGVTRYRSYADLLDYCSRSANPVGRLMLHLYDQADSVNLRAADAICSALQLINFWQDVGVDWGKRRIYLPQEDMARFGVSEEEIASGDCGPGWQALMRFQVERSRALMLSGAGLALRVPGRVGWELRLVVQGGLRILERIEAAGYDVFRHRPKLDAGDWLLIGWRALWMKIGLSRSAQLG